jgi:hypothetical protein
LPGLALEAPIAVPIPGGRPERGAGRVTRSTENATGPGRRGQALARWATGLVQGGRMPGQLGITVPGLAATTRPRTWRRGDAQLLAEAFFTASGKPEPLPAGQHAADAAAAELALVEVLDSSAPIASRVCCLIASRRRHGHDCRGRTDDLVYIRTTRIVGV